MRGVRERAKKTVYLRKPAHKDDPYGGASVTWGNPVPIRAQHQPMSGGTEARVYGESLNHMRAMFYDGTEPIREGDVLSPTQEARHQPLQVAHE